MTYRIHHFYHNMKNIKFKYVILFFILIILIGAFYWYEWRPINIRKECFAKTMENVNKNNGDREDVNYFYKKCFREYGEKDSF